MPRACDIAKRAGDLLSPRSSIALAAGQLRPGYYRCVAREVEHRRTIGPFGDEAVDMVDKAHRNGRIVMFEDGKDMSIL